VIKNLEGVIFGHSREAIGGAQSNSPAAFVPPREILRLQLARAGPGCKITYQGIPQMFDYSIRTNTEESKNVRATGIEAIEPEPIGGPFLE